MTNDKKPREFWLAKPDLDFDLNWKNIHAAEYPHKNTKVDTLHVIEYSALEAAQKENEELKEKLAIAAEALERIAADRASDFADGNTLIACGAMEALSKIEGEK